MSATTDHLIAHLDEVALEILATYGAARRQIDEWNGGYAESVIGATPPVTIHTLRDDMLRGDTEDSSVDLTPVESQAARGATTSRHLQQLNQQLTRCCDTGRRIWAEVDGVEIPEPAKTEAARLAVMVWAVRRAVRDPRALSVGKLRNYHRCVMDLHDLCVRFSPPPPTQRQDQCHTHLAAGGDALIDNNRYRGWRQCRWCGDFRKLHGVDPPVELVRHHDRGGYMSAIMLRKAGIRVA